MKPEIQEARRPGGGMQTRSALAANPIKGKLVQPRVRPSASHEQGVPVQDRFIFAGSMFIDVEQVSAYTIKECTRNALGSLDITVEIWSKHSATQEPTWVLTNGNAAAFLASINSPLYDAKFDIITPVTLLEFQARSEFLMRDSSNEQ